MVNLLSTIKCKTVFTSTLSPQLNTEYELFSDTDEAAYSGVIDVSMYGKAESFTVQFHTISAGKWKAFRTVTATGNPNEPLMVFSYPYIHGLRITFVQHTGFDRKEIPYYINKCK